MRKLKYESWERILLDTGVVIHLIHSLDERCEDADKLFAKLLITALASPRENEKGKAYSERVFCISAITLSELLTQANGDEKKLNIIKALNSANVEFLPFDDEAADYLNSHYHPYLGRAALNKFARGNGWPEHDLVNGREWINRDLMIAATAQRFKCDVILTCDVNTFYPMAQEVGCFSALVFPGCFDISESERYIFRYDPKKAEEFYHARTGRHSAGYQPASPGHQNGIGPADIQEGAPNGVSEAPQEASEAVEVIEIPVTLEAVEVVEIPEVVGVIESLENLGIKAEMEVEIVEIPDTTNASEAINVKPG